MRRWVQNADKAGQNLEVVLLKPQSGAVLEEETPASASFLASVHGALA